VSGPPATELVRDLWWFIENANDEMPDRTERFFELRARVRVFFEKNPPQQTKAPALEPLWQTEGGGPREAAKEFARSYWAAPRKLRDFTMRADGSATFGVTGGFRNYAVTYKPGTFGNLLVVSYVIEDGP
jgi:hypothetical protein